MPKVIVYVPAAAWRRLEERGLDPAKAVREFARAGYEMTEPELTEREPGSNEEGAEASAGQSPSSVAQGVAADSPTTGVAVPRSVSPDEHFKPYPKPSERKR